MSERPFANGTEGDSWMYHWCNQCEHDHAMHGENGEGPGCPIIGETMIDQEDFVWPECWVSTDDYWQHLPALISCLKFKPCEACGGDREPEPRKAQTEHIFLTLKGGVA